MCNCIKETEQKIISNLKTRFPDKTYDEELNGFQGTGMQNVMLSLGEDGGYKTYQEFKIESSFKKVNGTQSRPKRETVNMIHNFCPFCGENKDKSTENHDDRETISDEAHEIAYVAKKFGVPKWHVMRVKHELKTNARKAIYENLTAYGFTS